MMQLCIIGNGFDLAHGVPSSYYKFRDYVKANDFELFKTLECYIDIEDFWGDFENNLSRLSREHLMIAVDTMADCMIDCYDESSDDFSYADFYQNRTNIQWNISWYSEKDKAKIEKFASALGIDSNKIKLFRLE